MASIAGPGAKRTLKPSFAKVLATSYNTERMVNVSGERSFPVKDPSESLLESNFKGPCVNDKETPASTTDINPARANVNSCNTDIRTESWAQTTVGQPGGSDATSQQGTRSDSDMVPKSRETDEGTTNLSLSDESVKPPSIDGKSVTSGATFALDEKESLRPDDSASLRAVEEEDIVSPSSSVAPSSRVGSDLGAARAFRDQLQEIASLPNRGIVPRRLQHGEVATEDSSFDTPRSIEVAQPVPVTLGSDNVITPAVQQPPPVPDEKLLEALESQRDRLFVLKLEQDLIDFVKDPKETELSLPNCNAFYRMLAHRLADYYLLGHMVDDSMTSVRISKTPYCRIPPPLSGLSTPGTAASTPPLEMPARRIMRRRGDSRNRSGTNTGNNSEGPSKAASDVDLANGITQSTGDSKIKGNLSREEREAKYKEARQRIFGDTETTESSAESPNNVCEEKDLSRSSSASGKKKATKKHRNYNDDGFEARSQFNMYYTPNSSGATYVGDGANVSFNGYTVPMSAPPFPAVSPNFTQAVPYSAFPTLGQQAHQQYPWITTYPFPNANGGTGSGYESAQNVAYDLTLEFQRGMQSFQPSALPGSGKSDSPVGGFPDMHRPASQQTNILWPQTSNQAPYPSGAPYVPTTHSEPSSTFASNPTTAPYPYGQLPIQPSTNLGRNQQHPLPGSYNRPQFNPQSQSFIPGGRSPPFGTPIQTPKVMPLNMSHLPSHRMGGSNNLVRPSPPIPKTAAANFSDGSQNSNQYRSYPPHAPQQRIQSGGVASPSVPQKAGTSSSGQSPASLPAQSSIAKWGTPSHLPAKPPPPATPISAHSFSNASRIANTLPSALPSNGLTPVANPARSKSST